MTRKSMKDRVATALGVPAERVVVVNERTAFVPVDEAGPVEPPPPWSRAQQLEGWKRLRALMNEAAGDYTVRRSPDALMLAALVNDILHDCTPDDWLGEFDRKTARAINGYRAWRQHEASRSAQAWVREHFTSKRDEYRSKTEFCSDYVPLVADQFGIKPPSARTMAERWLKGL